MDKDVMIRVEGLGKKYVLGQGQQPGRYTALRDVLAEAVKAPWRKWRHGASAAASSKKEDEEFWALRDVNLEIRRGDVVGIIGRNGAGKSTLLKILSRITEPTEGRITLKGRVASLLEVGTGFHPELTGRENIFLNGAILGMHRHEIRARFDEIVAFAEVEKFLDTPVKRYSSGMYIRLAFAVAAHLEPEILIVDEVLAVGDTEFQKKCLGKMQDVAGHGRTVLFVSHNMSAILSLTRNAVLMESGRMIQAASTSDVIANYVQRITKQGNEKGVRRLGAGTRTVIKQVRFLDDQGIETGHYLPGSTLQLEVSFWTDGSEGLSIDLFLLDSNRTRLGFGATHHFYGKTLPAKQGNYSCLLRMKPLFLSAGTYFFDVATAVTNVCWDHHVDAAVTFQVVYCNPTGREWDFQQSYGFGCMALLCETDPTFHEV